MNNGTFITLGLTIAIALTGSSLVEHSTTANQAPGAFSDITIAEAENQKIPPESSDKAAPQTGTPSTPSTADAPPAVQTTPGEESKGTPPRKP